MENQMSVKQALQANNQVLKSISIPLELIDAIGAPLKFVMETNQNCIAAIEQAEKQQAMLEQAPISDDTLREVQLVEAEQAKESWETENGGETWEEEDFNCYYTIAEVELESVKPVENPNLVRGGWIGREAECCGKCGTNLRFLAKFCDKCGMPVDREDLSGKTKREIREHAKI